MRKQDPKATELANSRSSWTDTDVQMCYQPGRYWYPLLYVQHQSSLKTRAPHPLKFIPLQPFCDTYKYSFWPRTIIDWNSLPSDRLFTVLYFSVRSSRSSFLRYGLPSCMMVKTTYGTGAVWEEARKTDPRRPPPWYIWKSRWTPLTVRRAIFPRSHEKIGDCDQFSHLII